MLASYLVVKLSNWHMRALYRISKTFFRTHDSKLIFYHLNYRISTPKFSIFAQELNFCMKNTNRRWVCSNLHLAIDFFITIPNFAWLCKNGCWRTFNSYYLHAFLSILHAHMKSPLMRIQISRELFFHSSVYTFFCIRVFFQYIFFLSKFGKINLTLEGFVSTWFLIYQNHCHFVIVILPKSN